MNTNHQQQPLFSTEPIRWQEGIECFGHQLADVIVTAQKTGWEPVRLKAVGGAKYRLEFQRAPQVIDGAKPYWWQ